MVSVVTRARARACPMTSRTAITFWAGIFSPQTIGVGRFQVVAKYGEATYDYPTGTFDVDQTTSELDLNYIIKGSNARISLFYIDVDFSPTAAQVVPDITQVGIGLQVQI